MPRSAAGVTFGRRRVTATMDRLLPVPLINAWQQPRQVNLAAFVARRDQLGREVGPPVPPDRRRKQPA